jgi:hypothetical protein
MRTASTPPWFSVMDGSIRNTSIHMTDVVYIIAISGPLFRARKVTSWP